MLGSWLSVGAIILEGPARGVACGSGGICGCEWGCSPPSDLFRAQEGRGLSCGVPVSPSFLACFDSPCGFSRSFPEASAGRCRVPGSKRPSCSLVALIATLEG